MMITITLKNKYIYYAIENIHPQLDPRFATHLWELVSANSDDEFDQTIQVPKNELVKIYVSVSLKPEGVASAINREINDILLPQLIVLGKINKTQLDLIEQAALAENNYNSNSVMSEGYAVMMSNINNLIVSNEVAYVLYHVSKNNANNYQEKLNKIKRGKDLILKPYQ